MNYILLTTILVVSVSICHIQTRNVPRLEVGDVGETAANETAATTTTTLAPATTTTTTATTTVDVIVNETVKNDVISLNIEVANASKLEFDQPLKVAARYMCPPGYTGNSCEERDPCFFNGPCGPYGRCVPAYDGTAKCECQSGYTGPTCQTSDPCSAYPCQNGKCVVQGNSFVCQCSSGYTGQFCESVETNVAYPNANSGSYNNYGSSYGNDYSSPCYANPCQNGGQCSPYGSTYVCQCPTGYSGQTCDNYASGSSYGGSSYGGGGYAPAPAPAPASYGNDYSGPCYGNPCQNGGQCVPYGSTFICQCQPGYSGQKCDSGYGGGASYGSSYSGSYQNGGSSYGGTGSSYGSGGYGGCHPNPCQNGGQCSPYSGSGGNNYGNVVCQCPQGYTGQSCGSSVYANGNY